jgi:hypothetical protein
MSLDETWSEEGAAILSKEPFDAWHPSDILDEMWPEVSALGPEVKDWPPITLASVIALTRSDESVVQFAVKRRFRMAKAQETRKTLMADLVRRGIKSQVVAYVFQHRPGGRGPSSDYYRSLGQTYAP